jgi:excisionase family DNA binding protein
MYTVNGFMANFKISRTFFYAEVKRGRLRLTKIGRASRIAKADADSWAASLPTIGGGAQ